jgi:hypothetical protein
MLKIKFNRDRLMLKLSTTFAAKNEILQELLSGVRQDVYEQFDEKQNEWTPLARYTVNKKEKAGSDERILHEGRSNTLREAYADAGEVVNGKLIYSFPTDKKPYAKDHQFGVTGTEADSLRKALQKEADYLDMEYERALRKY